MPGRRVASGLPAGLAAVVDRGDRRRDQQHGDAQCDADRGDRRAQQPCAAARERQPRPQREVARDATARGVAGSQLNVRARHDETGAGVRPSRTTISRSE